jgi:hypothetical protein
VTAIARRVAAVLGGLLQQAVPANDIQVASAEHTSVIANLAAAQSLFPQYTKSAARTTAPGAAVSGPDPTDYSTAGSGPTTPQK